MSRPLRLEFPGSLWHVTARGNERRCIFADDRDRDRFLDLLGDAVRRFRWILTSYALMPNHYHLVVELTENTLSSGMKWLNGAYAQWFNRVHERVGHLFQGRFKSFLIDEETYSLEVLRYVVLNPVRAKIAARPEEYQWTSHQAIISQTAAPSWLAVDNVLAQFGEVRDAARARYERFVEEGIGSTRRPWDDLVGQMYLGSDVWIDKVREQIALKPRATDHPAANRNVVPLQMATIVSAVATGMRVDEELIRHGHGGMPRMIAAWIACYEGLLSNAQIAAALRLRSASHVSELVRTCDRELRLAPSLQNHVDYCLDTLRRKNRQPKT